MKVVVAMDKFKGSLDAATACACVRQGLLRVLPDAEVLERPLADGGEGTVDACMAQAGGEWVPLPAMGPLHAMTVDAGYAWFPQAGRCVVEMAAASGLTLLRPERRNPWLATTYGTGQLLMDAFTRQSPVWLAVGGSATVDGGVGAASALGWRFLDEQGRRLEFGGQVLERIRYIEPPAARDWPPLLVLCDVTNTLCGESGAARVFGPQKGATPDMVERLEAGLQNLALRAKESLGIHILEIPGGGAAGGLAAGAAAFLGGRVVSGIDVILEGMDFRKDLEGADLVITGEGSFDVQSLDGKVASGVLRVAQAAGCRVAVLAGRVALSPDQWEKAGFSTALALRTEAMSLEYAVQNARELLAERAAGLVRSLAS